MYQKHQRLLLTAKAVAAEDMTKNYEAALKVE